MTIPLPLTPITLTGRLVRMAPLSHDQHDGLVEAASDGQLWDRWYTSVPDPAGMRAEIDRRLALQELGTMQPFTVIRAVDDTVIGMTTFMDIAPSVPRVEIGSTWNRESVHGTGTNAESKLLLMTYAFETLQVEAVRFRTHKMNLQSRAAIERLGAELEGVLRADSIDEYGVVRDTAQYSIVARTWPMVKANLQHRLRHR